MLRGSRTDQLVEGGRAVPAGLVNVEDAENDGEHGIDEDTRAFPLRCRVVVRLKGWQLLENLLRCANRRAHSSPRDDRGDEERIFATSQRWRSR